MKPNDIRLTIAGFIVAEGSVVQMAEFTHFLLEIFRIQREQEEKAAEKEEDFEKWFAEHILSQIKIEEIKKDDEEGDKTE